MKKLLQDRPQTTDSARDARADLDRFFMTRALDLAWRAAGRTRPNPLVGAVVVNAGAIVGEGNHAAYGLDHAEHVALDAAGRAARGGTLYATLEPCTHFGHTPPCITRVIESGVSRVVVATLDPDERMNGRGVRLLRESGIDVQVGCCAERAIVLNAGYFKRVLGLGPTVTLKMAVTLDGRIASRPGSRDAITGPRAQEFVHRLRAENDAVVVGRKTAVVDRPRLDCRLVEGVSPPIPVVLEGAERPEQAYPWTGTQRTFWVVSPAEGGGEAALREVNRIEGVSDEAGVSVRDAVERLAATGLTLILVEGGGAVFSSFVKAGAWDVMHILVAPALYGRDGVPLAPDVGHNREVEAVFAGTVELDRDTLLSFVRADAWQMLKSRLVGG